MLGVAFSLGRFAQWTLTSPMIRKIAVTIIVTLLTAKK